MSYGYRYETFSARGDKFDKKFTGYLNRKAKNNWRVKQCSYCHDTDSKKMYASCMFERKV